MLEAKDIPLCILSPEKVHFKKLSLPIPILVEVASADSHPLALFSKTWSLKMMEDPSEHLLGQYEDHSASLVN